MVNRGRQNGRATRPDSGLPAGCVFHPTAYEVISVLLLKKLQGLEVIDLVLEFDVFTVDPHLLPMDCSPLSRTNEGYYFAPKENRNSPRRDTPSGYWQSTRENVPIYNPTNMNEIVGFKNRLSFYYNGAVTNWRMTEYRCNLDDNSELEENYIVCKVRKKVVEEEEEEEMIPDSLDNS